MKLFDKLFGRKLDTDNDSQKPEVLTGNKSVFIGELPSETPGELVIIKSTFVESKLKKLNLEKEIYSHEEQILILAMALTKTSQPQQTKLLQAMRNGTEIVLHWKNCREILDDPKLPSDWNEPGYAVHLFR